MNGKIERMLKETLQNLNYEEIILFGSRARGDFSEESDYDILIVLQDSISIREKMESSAKLRREIAKMGIDADIIIKSREEVEYYENKIGNIVRNALREGVAL
ncbi:nucleotidyltransferase domain-containing protein [bacterium]|nr:nucleotidyltransferase domain-containing protein [bacterium]